MSRRKIPPPTERSRPCSPTPKAFSGFAVDDLQKDPAGNTLSVLQEY